MAAIAEFTEIEFGELDPAEPGDNLIYYFAETGGMEAAGRDLTQRPADVAGMEGSNCYFLSYGYPPGSGEFVIAFIVVNRDIGPDHIHHCLLEETAQSLGLPNDDPRIVPSVFNDGMRLHSLSLIDKVLLRLLYDPRLPPGTPRAEALTITRAILGELNPSG